MQGRLDRNRAAFFVIRGVEGPSGFAAKSKEFEASMNIPATTTLLVCATLVLPTNGAGQAFDHSTFDQLLRLHVDSAGLVDYDAFGSSAEFARYLTSLSEAEFENASQGEQLALWINAYNAYTIALVTRHGERRSIRNINRTSGFIRGKGPWSERFAGVGGRTYTLDEIEHEIIRPRFGEPRIHFALVCAALGCPPLRRKAYTGSDLNRQLDEQAQAFLLSSPDKNFVNVASRTVWLSPIFDWYGKDFGRNDAELLTHLARYYPPGPERELLRSGKAKVQFTEYEWSLNHQRRQQAVSPAFSRDLP